MSVIGIDLGYQTSTIGVPKTGGIEVILNEYSKRATPTWVSLGEKNRELGEAGKLKQPTNVRNTIGNFKHLIGRNFADADVQEELKYIPVKSEAMEDGSVGFRMKWLGEEKLFSATQIYAMILTKLKMTAETDAKGKISDCCIGVPALFNDRQRHALLAACKMASLNCLKLMSEPAAVALAYGIYKQDLPAEGEKPRRVIFCDIGHSQTAMSACSLVKGKLTVEATAAAIVGGRDLDSLLFEHFATQFKEKPKVDVKSNVKATIRLMNECEKVKKLMSANSTPCPLNIECLMDDKDVSGKIARADFEDMAAGVFAKIEDVAKQLLAQLKASDDKFNIEDIDFIEIVGGSVRIPAIKSLLTRVFAHELSTTLNLDEAVARGCALQGAIVSPTFRVRDFSVSDRTMYSINLSWKSALADGDDEADESQDAEVYKANSKMGMSKMLTFYRAEDFELTAKYTDPTAVSGNMEHIGNFKIQGVTKGFDGKSQKVKAKVMLDDNGCFVLGETHMIEKLPPSEEVNEDVKPMDLDAKDSPKDAPKDAPAPAADGETKDEKTEAKDEKTEAKDEKTEADEKADKKAGEKKAEPAKKKQKTTKTTPLKVIATKPNVLTDTEVHALLEGELAMISQDRAEREKSDAKNALEEYIYHIREKMSDETIQTFIKEEDREAYSSQLTTFEDWIYDEGEDVAKSVYNGKLAELHTIGEATLKRAAEAELRGPAIDGLQKSIVVCRKFVEQHAAGDDKYAHISAENVKNAADSLASKEKWLNDNLAKQAGLAKWDPVAFTAAQVAYEQSTFDAVYTPIMNTPVPKAEPPKEEPKAEGAAVDGDAKPAEGDASVPAADGEDKPAPSETMDID